MAKTEYECRILDINVADFVKKLESLKATNKGEKLQKRFVYDFTPKDENKWIRLRTNGEEVTLTIKNLKGKGIDGTLESEIIVSDFDEANSILEELGYKHRNYQENKRWSWELNGVSIEIDTWPMIPTYVEIEGSSVSEVENTLKLLEINKENVTTLDVESVYRVVYGIDVMKIKDLKLDEASQQVRGLD